MKKVIAKIVVFCSTFALTACDFLAFLRPNENQNTNPDTPVVTPTITSVSVVLNKE